MRLLTGILTIILLLSALAVGGYFYLKSELTYLKIYTPKISFTSNNKDDISTEIYDNSRNLIYQKIYQRSKLLPEKYNIKYANYLVEEILSEGRKFSEVYGVNSWKYLIMNQFNMDIYSLKGQVLNHYATELLKDINMTGFYGEVLRWYTLDNLRHKYTPDQLCRLYLDTFEYGERIYGIAAAAEHYFGKEIYDVSLLELSYLISMRLIKDDENVANYHQELEKNARRNLKRLYEAGLINTDMYQAEMKNKVYVNRNKYPNLDPAFSTEILKTVSRDKRFDIGRQSIKIYTSYSQQMTTVLEKAVAEYFKGNYDNQQAVLVLINTEKNVIEAAVGSRSPKSSHNRAFYLKRQTASTFKPIVYLTAFSNGVSPADSIVDKPYTFKSGSVDYKPNNYLSAFYGEVLVRSALTMSMNNATVKIAENVGLAKVAKMAKDLGMEGMVPAFHAMPLGAIPATPLNWGQVFSTIANYGVRQIPHFVQSIDYQGHRYTFKETPVRVVDAASVYQILYIMQSVANEGTARGAKLFDGTAAKTGTTNAYRDAWTVAIFDKYVLVVWIGYDDSRSMGENAAGGMVAAPMVPIVQQHIYGERKKFTLRKPDNIVLTRVNLYSGLLDPTDKENTYFEALKREQYAKTKSVPTKAAKKNPKAIAKKIKKTDNKSSVAHVNKNSDNVKSKSESNE